MENIIHQISSSDKFYKTNFFNTLSGVRSLFLLGSKSKEGIANLAVFNSIVHVGANPPLLGLVFRPEVDEVRRHSLENIKNTEFFTLNLLNSNILDKGHQTSAKYGSDINEFEAVGLTVIYTEYFEAPYVGEAHLKIGLKPLECHSIITNQTTFLVAQVCEVFIDPTFIKPCGSINHDDLKTIVISGLEDYYNLSFVKKKEFARP